MKRNEIEQLREGESFRNQREKSALIETHISWVILTDQYAYKIKKSIQVTFLDFSSLEKRKYYCEQELILNKRLAPQMYLNVIPIFKKGNTVSLNQQEGEVIDYAVFMKRMDMAKEMDKLLKENNVDKHLIKNLAAKISAFHLQATVVKKKTEIDSQQGLFNDLSTVQPFVRKHLGDHYAAIIQHAIKKSDNFLSNYRAYLAERSLQGYVRDLHGDLHTSNIFLCEDPVIFDCIEFSDELRQIDVLDEIAFLCMDLEAYGRPDLSEYFYQNYLQYSEMKITKEARLLFNYYKCHRANIRAKVHTLYAIETADKTILTQRLQAVSTYLAALENYMVEF
ncbi:hypothetical protein [Parapedobacter tibetensis]|uniref:hypothetical protein n=1 Tax=Parapedobacter tibetensis TaxID=2972951 RepID=UPI00214D343D|nr:hypothetical protein [Parapedobacter tibetensis]